MVLITGNEMLKIRFIIKKMILHRVVHTGLYCKTQKGGTC